MELSPVAGMRTRARAQQATATERKRKRKMEKGGFQVVYLQLRSRTLVMTLKKRRIAPASRERARSALKLTEGVNSGAREQISSRCSSNSSSGGLVVEEAQWSRSRCPEGEESVASFECGYSGNERVELSTERRETTPSIEPGELESTARVPEGSVSRMEAVTPPSAAKVPPEEEIEAFFAAAEKNEAKRFAEKYNFDLVKDVPLQGRYEWVQVKP